MINKRILSLFLIITLLSGVLSFASENAAEESIVEGKYELLEILGVIDKAYDGVFASETQVTRGRLMKYLSKIAGLDGGQVRQW